MSRGGTFSKNLDLQVFSLVMVIRHKVSAPLRGQFENLASHPANREVAMLSTKDDN